MPKIGRVAVVFHAFCLICRVILVDASNSVKCPVESLSTCTCKTRDGGDTLHIECIDASLMQVPADIPETAKTLYISDDHIEVLATDAFRSLHNLHSLELPKVAMAAIEVGAFNGLSTLVDLKLAHNHLTNLETGTFDGLTGLVWLDLNHNKISSLPMGIFRDLRELKFLHLEGNMLTGPGLEQGVFDGLVNITQLMISQNDLSEVPTQALRSIPGDTLQTLSLKDNKIASLPQNVFNVENLRYLHTLLLAGNGINSSNIDKNAFRGLSLHNLDLSSNSIQELNESAFRDIFLPPVGDRVPFLNLDLNPLRCDCKMRGFWDWWKDSDVVVSGSCQRPTHLKGTPIMNLTSTDLRCRQDLILPPPLEAVIEVGASDTLCCSEIRYEGEDLTVKWFGPGHVESAATRCLLVNMTSREDEGVYTCVALTTESYDEVSITVTSPRMTTTRSPPAPTTAATPTDVIIVDATATLISNTSTANSTDESNVPVGDTKGAVTTAVVIFCVVFVVGIVGALIYVGCRNRRKEKKKAKGDVRSSSVTWTSMQGDSVKMQGVAKPKTTNAKYEKLAPSENV